MANVYILRREEDKYIQGVYATKQAAFNAIKADAVAQVRRFEDDYERFVPTADSVILNEDIFAHYNEYTNDLIGFTQPAENRFYRILEYEVKD